MGLFDFLRPANINAGLEEFRASEGALLLDVRTAEEYDSGHIPGSVNLPLQSIDEVDLVAEGLDTALYVYCRSGARSSQACEMLRDMGYRNVRNIGGLGAYSGKLSR
jgi:rhodanese-related sulfurtransferase